MALAASLEYHHRSRVEETRQGIFIFTGDASDYQDWEFRNELKYTNAKEEERPKIMAEIVTSLRGDAFRVAKDLGMEDLTKPDGWKLLKAALKDLIFPRKREEAKVLYKQINDHRGKLSRQPGETMVSYV